MPNTEMQEAVEALQEAREVGQALLTRMESLANVLSNGSEDSDDDSEKAFKKAVKKEKILLRAKLLEIGEALKDVREVMVQLK